MELTYDYFKNKPIQEKLLFIEDLFSIIKEQAISENQAKKFIRNTFEHEINHYIKERIMDIAAILTIRKRLNKHFMLDFLMEIEESENCYVIIRGLKYLFIFGSDEVETMGRLQHFYAHENADVASEAYVLSGLITLLQAYNTEVDYLDSLKDSQRLIGYSKDICVNRDDANFYLNILEFQQCFIQKDSEGIEELFQKLTNDVWLRSIQHVNGNGMPQLEYKLYKIMLNLKKMFESASGVDSWIDFKSEFSNLNSYFCEMEQCKLTENVYYQKYLLSFNDNFTEFLLNPFLANNFLAQIIRIEALLNDVEDQEKQSLLKYLKNLIGNAKKKDINKKSSLEIAMTLSKIFPQQITQRILDDLSNISDPRDSASILHLVSRYNTENYNRDAEVFTGDYIGEEIFIRLWQELKECLPNYPADSLKTFLTVLEHIIAYTINTTREKNKYLFLYKESHGGKGNNAVERDLQDSLYEYLDYSRIKYGIEYEKKQIADGGRVDIAFSDRKNTFPIELKKTTENIDKESIKKAYLSQVQTYIYPYNQLGIFVLLDLTNKTAPSTDIRNLFFIEHLTPNYEISNKYPDRIVVIIVPGNKILPSDRSTYK